MKVHDITDDEGRVVAFEVGNARLHRHGMVRILARVPGVTILRRPVRLLSWFREESFCEFELGGVRFEAMEPFGDNSRYWIGPSPPRWVPQLDAVRAAFLVR